MLEDWRYLKIWVCGKREKVNGKVDKCRSSESCK